MARKQKSIKIGGNDYKLTQLGALEGRKLWLELVQIVAAPLEKLARTDGGQVDDATMIAAVGALVDKLDTDTAERLYAAFGKHCEVHIVDERGDRWPTLEGMVFDDHFAGNYVAMSQWLGECILFNFLDSFFPGGSVGGMLAQLRRAGAASKSTSPTDSTGSSGAS